MKTSFFILAMSCIIGAMATVTSVNADSGTGLMQSTNLRNLAHHDGSSMEEGGAYSPTAAAESDEDAEDEQEDGPGVIEDTMGNETLGNRRGRGGGNRGRGRVRHQPRRRHHNFHRPNHYYRRSGFHGGINCGLQIHKNNWWCLQQRVVIR